MWNDFKKNIRAGVGGVAGEVIQRELFWWMWEQFWGLGKEKNGTEEQRGKKGGKLWENH